MGFLLAIALVALLIPALSRGSYARLAFLHWRQRGLLVTAIGIQLVLGLLDLEGTAADIGFGLLVGSYVLMLGFVAANLVRTGMVVVGIGIAANALCILVNHGMPVDPPSGWADRVEVSSTVKHHPYDPEHDDLRFLADIVPVPGFGQMVSFGDLILAAGLLDAVFHASRQGRGRAGARGAAIERDDLIGGNGGGDGNPRRGGTDDDPPAGTSDEGDATGADELAGAGGFEHAVERLEHT